MALAHGIRTLGVVGGGQMGLGITYVASLHAQVPRILLYDRSSSQLQKSLKLMDKLLDKEVGKGRLTGESAKEVRARVEAKVVSDEPGKGMEGIEEADMVIEAASESESLKTSLFRSLGRILRPDAILASNTSSISITKLASAALREGQSAASKEGITNAGRVVGIHFFNPVPVMKLVELIPGLQTSEDTLSKARAFAIACGKEVTTSKDVPGFISNALLMPFLNEAIMCLEKGVATKEDIDKTLKLGMAHPMGPLQLADFIGLDTCLAIQQTLFNGTGDSKYRPSVLLGRMVDAGWLGKKSGKGFYDYDS